MRVAGGRQCTRREGGDATEIWRERPVPVAGRIDAVPGEGGCGMPGQTKARCTVWVMVVTVLLAGSCASCGAAQRKAHAEIPLHWEIGWIDSLGDLPADEFLFLPGDRVRPGPPVGTVPGGGFVATIDSAIARRLIFRETALLIATRYSREQQLELEKVVRGALADPATVGKMWAERESVVGMLQGQVARQGGNSEYLRCLLSAREAATLRGLALSAWYHLEDVPLARDEDSWPPRFFLVDIIELMEHADGKWQLPPDLSTDVLADTTLPFSARLEYSRIISRSVEAAFHELRPPIDADTLAAHAARHLRPVYEQLRRDRALPTRYHWLDDPDAPGNPMR